jgi:hypothetical protein
LTLSQTCVMVSHFGSLVQHASRFHSSCPAFLIVAEYHTVQSAIRLDPPLLTGIWCVVVACWSTGYLRALLYCDLLLLQRSIIQPGGSSLMPSCDPCGRCVCSPECGIEWVACGTHRADKSLFGGVVVSRCVHSTQWYYYCAPRISECWGCVMCLYVQSRANVLALEQTCLHLRAATIVTVASIYMHITCMSAGHSVR